MSELNPALLLKGARAAAWKYTPLSLVHWRDDIAQDIAEHVLHARRRTPILGKFLFRWGAWHAIRRLLYLLRYQVELPPQWDAPTDAPNELGPIALWRLQAVWQDLTDLERLALTLLMSGESLLTQARSAGVGRSAMYRAKQAALDRINNPGAFSRGREYQRLDLSAPRPPAASAKVAAYKARDAERARQKRAAKKAAASRQPREAQAETMKRRCTV